MLKYFKISLIIMILGMLFAFYWGEYHLGGMGLKMLFIALFLVILEITLSFDNAIVNALRLEKMTEKWRQRFITWGILIAVFGMRLLFPILIVAFFSKQTIVNVFSMALNDITQYSRYLQEAHIPLLTFGGVFLLIIFINYFFNPAKKIYWISGIEKFLAKLGKFNHIWIIISLIVVSILPSFANATMKNNIIQAGLGAILTFLVINGLTEFLENKVQQKDLLRITGNCGFISFLYLELIDASFSFDGLLSAFAISRDIIIITIGLAVGAMFVRSLTLYMVDKKTLKNFIYLEHGAHWAIGFLAIVMLFGIKVELPEWVTGTVSLIIILIAFICSIVEQRKTKNTINLE